MSTRGNAKMIAGLLLGTLLFLVIALTGPALWQMLHPSPGGDGAAVATHDLPWQIETLPGGGTRVFGVRPGQDTIAQIASTWPTEAADMKVALVRDPVLGALPKPAQTLRLAPLIRVCSGFA